MKNELGILERVFTKIKSKFVISLDGVVEAGAIHPLEVLGMA